PGGVEGPAVSRPRRGRAASPPGARTAPKPAPEASEPPLTSKSAIRPPLGQRRPLWKECVDARKGDTERFQGPNWLSPYPRTSDPDFCLGDLLRGSGGRFDEGRSCCPIVPPALPATPQPLSGTVAPVHVHRTEAMMGNVVDLYQRPLPLEDDELIENLARFADGTLTETQVKSRHHLSNEDWVALGESDKLVELVE